MSAHLSTARVIRLVANSNTTSQNSSCNLDNTVTKKICTANGKCEIDKVWKATAKAEERTTLLKNLKSRGVGTAKMEQKYVCKGEKGVWETRISMLHYSIIL